MANDFYEQAAATRANMIEAELAAAKADLAAYRANNDVESAAQAVQQLANLEAERANLNALYQGYVANQTPRQPPQLTPEARQAKPPERMDASDILELARTSKYGKGLDWNDPHMRAGWQEAQRRRSRGE